VTVKVYVEGGGDHNKALDTLCRQGFSAFFQKAGLDGRMPRVVRCGGRRQAYDRFRTAHLNAKPDELAILLVDSEEAVVGASPWDHVRRRKGDGWGRPKAASEDQLYLMVQAMEAWFLADKEKLGEYYGLGFRAAALSQRTDVESIPKDDLLDGLGRATKDCGKGSYSKGDHSFHILALIRPEKVRASSQAHAERLLRVLDRVCG
jgi:hypothetical protein